MVNSCWRRRWYCCLPLGLCGLLGSPDVLAANEPRVGDISSLIRSIPLIRSRRWFWQSKYQQLKAVEGVSFSLSSGETLGIVGESGCGKSTLARALVGLVPATAGTVQWRESNLLRLTQRQWYNWRQEIQMVFQDPLASLDPRMTAGDIIAEPLQSFYPKLSKDQRQIQVTAMMRRVGLLPNLINRYPHEFSGGQCQRIGIARALICNPRLLICDESVSALDVSIQAQVINLLKELKRERELALLFIAHDLAVIKHISDKVLVMYLGHAVEFGSYQEIFSNPLHPYTKALMSAIPIPDPIKARTKTIPILEGELPSPIDPPSGCVFRTRCPLAGPECAITRPRLQGNNQHQVACLKVAV